MTELSRSKQSAASETARVQRRRGSLSAAKITKNARIGKWYWQEQQDKMADHADLLPPHWVLFDAHTCKVLESCLRDANQSVVSLSSDMQVDVASMIVTNSTTGLQSSVHRADQ